MKRENLKLAQELSDRIDDMNYFLEQTKFKTSYKYWFSEIYNNIFEFIGDYLPLNKKFLHTDFKVTTQPKYDEAFIKDIIDVVIKYKNLYEKRLTEL